MKRATRVKARKVLGELEAGLGGRKGALVANLISIMLEPVRRKKKRQRR